MFVWELVCNMLRSCLHGDEGVMMLSNKFLQRKIALSFPFSSMEQLFMSFDLGFPFVRASMLVRQGKPGTLGKNSYLGILVDLDARRPI